MDGSQVEVASSTDAWALCAVSLFNVVTDLAVLPVSFKILTQMIAGIFIGTRITKSDVLKLKTMFVPVLIILTCLIICCLRMGYGIHLLARVQCSNRIVSNSSRWFSRYYIN